MKRAVAAAVAVTAALVFTVTLPAGAPAAARRCTQGVIVYQTHAGAPATIDSYWKTNDCGQYQSPELKDTGGGIHYGDSWRTGVGVHSTASSPNAMSKAWNRYKNSPSGQIWCHRVYPDQGSVWYKANGTVCG